MKKKEFAIKLILVTSMAYVTGIAHHKIWIGDAQAASPIDNIHLGNWAELYRKYDKSRRPDQEWDEKTYGTAFGNHIDAMQDGYDSRTVQQAAVVVIWEAIAATELYHQRREGE